MFVSRFLKRIQARKNKIIQNMMVPNGTASDTFNGILNEAYIQSIAKSWYFFVAAICLASDTAWKRNVGITISTVASMWPILKVRNTIQQRKVQIKRAKNSYSLLLTFFVKEPVCMGALFESSGLCSIYFCGMGDTGDEGSERQDFKRFYWTLRRALIRSPIGLSNAKIHLLIRALTFNARGRLQSPVNCRRSRTRSQRLQGLSTAHSF